MSSRTFLGADECGGGGPGTVPGGCAILTLPLLFEEVELSLLDNMEEASSEKAESELVSWPSAPLLPLGIDRCFRNLISSASSVLHSRVMENN